MHLKFELYMHINTTLRYMLLYESNRMYTQYFLGFLIQFFSSFSKYKKSF